MGLLFALLNPLNFDEMCIVTNLKYIITVCYDVIILYNFLQMHSFFFPLVYIESAKTVNEMTLNEFVKLTML